MEVVALLFSEQVGTSNQRHETQTRVHRQLSSAARAATCRRGRCRARRRSGSNAWCAGLRACGGDSANSTSDGAVVGDLSRPTSASSFVTFSRVTYSDLVSADRLSSRLEAGEATVAATWRIDCAAWNCEFSLLFRCVSQDLPNHAATAVAGELAEEKDG